MPTFLIIRDWKLNGWLSCYLLLLMLLNYCMGCYEGYCSGLNGGLLFGVGADLDCGAGDFDLLDFVRFMHGAIVHVHGIYVIVVAIFSLILVGCLQYLIALHRLSLSKSPHTTLTITPRSICRSLISTSLLHIMNPWRPIIKFSTSFFPPILKLLYFYFFIFYGRGEMEMGGIGLRFC